MIPNSSHIHTFIFVNTGTTTIVQQYYTSLPVLKILTAAAAAGSVTTQLPVLNVKYCMFLCSTINLPVIELIVAHTI